MRSLVALAVLVATCAAGISVALWRGLRSDGADQHQAAAISLRTTAIDADIAHGQWVAHHRQLAVGEGAILFSAVPPVDDDQSILAGVVAATRSSGATLVSAQLGAAAGQAGSPGQVGLALTVKGPSESSLVAFAAAVQQQLRLMAAGSLAFTFTDTNTLQVSGAAFTRPGEAPPPLVSGGT